MKKKLIQILMLMVATVSVGSFVSCKDTNEDLYNELRTQNLETLTLAQLLETRVAGIQAVIDKLESCAFLDSTVLLGWINSEDQHLQDQIDAINAALKELAKADNYYTKDQIDKMRDALQAQIDLIPLTYATKDELANLTARVAAIEYLKNEVATLRSELAAIKSCECDCATVMTKLGALEADMAIVKDKANQALEGLKATDEIAKAAKTLAENAQTAAEKATQLAQDAQNTANQANTLAEACKTLLDNAVQWASDAKSDAEAAKVLAESNKERIAELEKTVSALNTEVSLATKAANDALQAAAAADAKAEANKELIDKLTERVAKNETEIENLKKSVDEMKDLAQQVGANTKAISTLEEKIKEYENMAKEVAALKQQVTDCQEICKTNLELAKAEIRKEIAELKTELVDRISASEAEIKEHHEAIEQLGKMIQECATKDDLTKILERLDALETKDIELDNRLVTTETTVAEIKPVVDKLKEDVYGTGGLMERIKKAEDTLKELDSFVKKLASYISAIQSTLAKQVTGIIVQGTYNPMFGSFNIPANIQSNVLVAYYGLPTKAVEFPATKDDGYYAYASTKFLTAEDWDIIEGDDIKESIKASRPLINKTENGKANAGKLYMTINPNTADLSGLELTLVNSQDEKSPIQLEAIQKSKEVLDFGYGRADNGFYEADAYISDYSSALQTEELTNNLVELGNSFRTKMSEMANNFFNGTTYSGNLGKVATDVYNVINTLNLDRSGLKCTYTDQDADGNDQEHSVYSQYNVAAAVLNPLHLESFKGVFDFVTIPGYEDMNDFIDKFAEELNSHVKFIFEDANGSWKLNQLLNNLKIDGVDLDQYANNLILNFKARVSSFTFDGNGYHFSIPATGNAIIMFDKDLKKGGAAVTIPDAAKFNDYNDLKGVTLVIGGDLSAKATATLYVPAIANGGSSISAYAFTELSNVAVNLTTSDAIEVVYINPSTGAVVGSAGTVGQLSGNSITTYTAKLKLEDLEGTDGSVSIPVAIEIADDAQKIVDKLATFVQDLNHTLAEINKYKDLIAGDDGWINKGFDKYLRQYLDKINNTTVYFFNSIPRRFGPFMVASNNVVESNQGKFIGLSTSKYAPTTVTTNNLRFYPTTKNMELIVPIARKHVAVTDLFDEVGTGAKGASGNPAYKKIVQNINKSNDGLNKVLDGTQRTIEINTDEMIKHPGFTYEIAYSVLDFQGKMSTEKYYIKVVK